MTRPKVLLKLNSHYLVKLPVKKAKKQQITTAMNFMKR